MLVACLLACLPALKSSGQWIIDNHKAVVQAVDHQRSCRSVGVMRTFLPAWTKGPVVAQAPWDNPPLGLWRGGVPICDLFGVNKTPTKVVNLGRDFWLFICPQ